MIGALLSTKMTAKRLALSESQVRKLVACGALSAIRIGRSVRFNADEVEALVRNGLQITSAKKGKA